MNGLEVSRASETAPAPFSVLLACLLAAAAAVVVALFSLFLCNWVCRVAHALVSHLSTTIARQIV